MRFMMMDKPGVDEAGAPDPEIGAKIGQLIGDMVQSGVLVATDGLLPSSYGSRLRIADGKFSVTDGPFAEAKELIGGFAIVKVNSKEEAIEHAKRFLAITGKGESEIRQMPDQSGYYRT